jgi:peptide/nickel transport system substrate-binding protein
MVALAAVAAVSACAGPATPAASNHDTLRIGRAYDMATLDPAMQATAGDFELANTVYSGLLRYKLGTTEVEPDLATKWSSNDAGTVWTFELRQGVQFQKGYGEVTADDVVATFERLTSDKLASPNADTMKAMQSIKAVSPYQVEMTLSAPDPALLGKLASTPTRVVSAKAVEKLGDSFGKNPVGSGPFQFDSWQPGQKLVLTAFDGYWGGKPKLPRVEYVPIPDPTTLYGAFDSGDIDMVQVNDPDHYTKYKSADGVTLSETPLLNVRHLQFNTTIAPFDNPKLREAVNYAIDRQTLLDGLFKGMSVPADNVLPPGVNYRIDNLLNYQYDPAKAKQLVAEAGYPNGLDVQFYVPNIDRFTTPATVIQQDLQKVGIRAKLQVMETQSFAALAAKKPGVPMWIQSHSFAPDPDRDLYAWFDTDGIPGTNWSHVSVPELDQALHTGTTSIDTNVRKQAFEQAQRLIADGNYGYYIDHEKYIWATHDFVKGFTADPLRTLRLDNVSLEG